MQHTYKTSNTCSTEIKFRLDNDGIVRDVEFIGGCNGNLKAIAKLVEGCSAAEIEEKLAGITCGRRPTSCADQLANAVKKAYNDNDQ